MAETFIVEDEAAMRRLGGSLVSRWQAGDVVLLEGDLGAGKTTLVRGIVERLLGTPGISRAGQEGRDAHTTGVRSPTFNLLQLIDTDPPVMHADLYRVKSWQGIGVEDYLDTHLCLVEWPDRAEGLVPDGTAWRILIEFAKGGRLVTVSGPRT